MNTAEQSKYRKFFYWIRPERINDVLNLIQNLKSLDRLPMAYLRQCECLNPNVDIMHILPAVWSKNCVRQGSWFRTSPLSECHLIVSNSPLNLSECIRSGSVCIEWVSELPQIQKESYLELLNLDVFKARAPEEWFHFLKNEIPLFQGFVERKNLGVSLEEFLDMHSANHANFLLDEEDVLCKARLDGHEYPCSLFSSDFTCSACLEIFGVLGEHLPKKMLKNCPGLKYVQLGQHEFLFTELNSN